MVPYLVLFSIWCLGSLQPISRRSEPYERILFSAAALLTILMVGFRYNVGGDWGAYLRMYEEMYFQPLSYALTTTDPAYGLLNWLSAGANAGIWIPNLGCAVVFVCGLGSLVKTLENRWLAMTIATPYLIIVVGMGYTRQAAAIGILCWALAGASERRIISMVIKVGLAALFHKTAILFLPILLAPMALKSPAKAIAGGFIFIILAYFVLFSSSDQLIGSYVSSNYQSSGAAIRIGMNVAAAVIFLIFKDKIEPDEYKRTIWGICSFMALASAVGLSLTSSSVGLDRISLFLIPLQVVTYTSIPYALSKTGKAVPSIMLTVLGYSFAVLYVYFNFGQFSEFWLPYNSVLNAELG